MGSNSNTINISQQNIKGKCDLKCSYNFNYTESNITAKNNGIMITLINDNTNSPPVLYNNQKYNISNIYLVCPSIHLFNGQQMPAEFIIQHSPVSGGNNLDVGIPISSSGESTTASSLLTEIINNISTNAPAVGESTNLNISNFNLQNIVPRKPFFSYTDNSTSTDWIVYGNTNAIPLSSSTIQTLGQIIKPFSIQPTGGDLYYNSKGASIGSSIGDDIYISCQPTGSSSDETAVEYEKQTTYDMENFYKNPTVILLFQILAACLVFILLFFLINYAFNFLTIKGTTSHTTTTTSSK